MILHNPYKGDYDHKPEVDKKGRFRDKFYYTGDLFVLPFDEKTKKRSVWQFTLFEVLLLAELLGQGMLNQTSSRTLWIVLPYLFQILPVLLMLVGTFEYKLSRLHMVRSEYDKGVARMRRSAYGLIVLTAVSFICTLVYIILRHGNEEFDPAKEVIYLLWHFLTVGLMVLYGKLYSKYFSQIENQKVE